MRWTRHDVFMDINSFTENHQNREESCTGSFTPKKPHDLLDFFVYIISCEKCHIWPITLQIHETSIMILPYFCVFSWMNLCLWKRHVWSIALESLFHPCMEGSSAETDPDTLLSGKIKSLVDLQGKSNLLLISSALSMRVCKQAMIQRRVSQIPCILSKICDTLPELGGGGHGPSASPHWISPWSVCRIFLPHIIGPWNLVLSQVMFHGLLIFLITPDCHLITLDHASHYSTTSVAASDITSLIRENFTPSLHESRLDSWIQSTSIKILTWIRWLVVRSSSYYLLFIAQFPL